jgi:NADPH:quinone reductase-like Zn-dependent oxidoreductase
VVLDMVGGDYVARNVKLLRDGGRHVSIAFLRGPRAELDLNAVMRRRLTLTGSTLRPRTREEKAAIAEALQRGAWTWLETGRVKPVVDSTYPLEDARRAHERMDRSAHIGKMVLTIGEGGGLS